MLRKRPEPALPTEELTAQFEVRERFLSRVELDLYQLLVAAVGHRAFIFAKPRVFELLRVVNAAQHLDDALRLDRKHVDFLLCDSVSGDPLCAVQIDHWDAEEQRFQDRQHLLEEALQVARFPVVHVASHPLPTPTELRQAVESMIDGDHEVRIHRLDAADSRDGDLALPPANEDQPNLDQPNLDQPNLDQPKLSAP